MFVIGSIAYALRGGKEKDQAQRCMHVLAVGLLLMAMLWLMDHPLVWMLFLAGFLYVAYNRFCPSQPVVEKKNL